MFNPSFSCISYKTETMFNPSFSCRLALGFALSFVLLASFSDAAPSRRSRLHVLRQVTALTEGMIENPRIRPGHGDFITFVSDGDVMGPGTAHLGRREVYVWENETGTIRQLTDTAGGESYDASRMTTELRTTRSPIIAFISTGNFDPAVGNLDGNPEVFIWIRDTDEFRQLTDTAPPVVNAGPNPSETGRCLVFESTGDLDNNDGTDPATPPPSFENSDGSRELFYIDFDDKQYRVYDFTQVSNGPAGTSSSRGSSGGFFFPSQCSAITYQSDADQLGIGATGINVYHFKRARPTTFLVSEPGNLGGSSIEPSMAGVGISLGGPSAVFVSDADIMGNGSTGFELFKYRTFRRSLQQRTFTDTGDSRAPVVSDGGVMIVLQSNAELIDTSKKIREGGPPPLNGDGNFEIYRLRGRQRVRQITRTSGCQNTAPTITGNAKSIALVSDCPHAGWPGGQPNVFLFEEIHRKDPRAAAGWCKTSERCCNVANGCYTSIFGRAHRVPRGPRR